MSRRLYGLSGLKLLLPRFCSWDLCGLRCLPWRAKRTRRAQQCSAIWRTTMPLSGPCLNGMLGSQKNRCRPIIRLFLRVFLYSGRNSTMASEKPDCRSEQRGCPRRRGDRTSGSLHVSQGPGCVKTCASRECAELFSPFSSFDCDCQCCSFPIQRNRDKLSTRKFDVGVFTQPGSKTEVSPLARHVRSTPQEQTSLGRPRHVRFCLRRPIRA